MKTRLALLITMVLLAIGLPIPAHAASPFTYTVSGDNAMITGYNGTPPAKLVIPDQITNDDGTYTVTAIGDGAFRQNQLTELTLPNALTSVGSYAFKDNRLTTLTLPNSLTTIDHDAFANNELTELTLPNTLTTISDWAFTNNRLTKVALPNTITAIGGTAFANNQLTELTLPNAITTIGDTAFAFNQLTELTLPNTITTMGSRAFSNNQLTDVTLPTTLTTISSEAFADNQLTDVTLPTALTSVGSRAFSNNRLSELTLPTTLAAIDAYAFFGNPDLDDVRFTGPAPTLGANALGTSDPTVRFPWKFGNPRASGGYTAPTWNSYRTIPVADVTFVSGSNIPTQSVDVDGASVATKPADPARAGYKFMGWYTGSSATHFDFTAPIAGDLTLTPDFDVALVLAGPRPSAVKLGDAFTWTPTTLTGEPSPTVTATGLPDGLEIDSDTGVISGTVTDPAKTGDHRVTITAANGVDPDVTLNLTISVEYFTYTVADGNATITGFHGAVPTKLVIPAEITDGNGTYPVTAIGDYAFSNNPDLGDVRFTGPAPTLGADALGTSDPAVRFPWKLGDPRTTGGYTAPTWHSYDTIAVADVTFAGDGPVATQSFDVDGTTTAVKPADPVKAGHTFTGWFADGASTPFDFSTPITGDTALSAGFELPPVSPEPGPAPNPSPVVKGLDPAITGTAREGKTLRAKPGSAAPVGTTLAYQWRANGKTIKGATKSWLPLRKAQAGKRITVTITAKTTGAPAVTKTSVKTKPVSSAKRRLVLSTYRVGKNKPVTVTATGLTARQKVIIWLGGTNRYVGRADSRGVITKTVTFAKDAEPGKRRVRVSGYASDGDRNRTIVTTVRYR